MKKSFSSGGIVLAFLISVAWAPPASATDGHFLHGVGAINAAMGGVGVAAPRDVLGAFYHNPAGLMGFSGTRFDLSMEMFKPDRTMEATVPTPQGVMSGSQRSKTEFVPIPAFGWSTELKEGKIVVGMGGLGIGGFGVDYAQTNTHPLLVPRQAGGFGQVFSSFSLLKVSPAVAFAPTERLWLGVSANLDWAGLAVDPFPAASPDGSVYPSATATDGAFGVGFQAGLIFKLTETASLGLAYTSPQVFDDFSWNSTNGDPSSPSFGTNRPLEFALDVPAVVAGGVAVDVTPRLFVEADAKYILYSSTEGFEESGFDATGAVKGFGWEDILVVAAGTEFKATDRVVLRGGYNYTDNPVPEEYSFFNISAPAIVQHHVTLGAGFELRDGLQISAAYYKALENEVTGPVWHPQFGAIEGSSVTSRMEEDSFLIQFSFLR